jgi:hypothetical protein
MATPQITRTCVECGAIFNVTPTRSPAAKWCSWQCRYAKTRRPTITRPCDHCGSLFTHRLKHEPGRPERRFCSRVCRSADRTRPLRERFSAFVDQTADPSQCWPWRGSLNPAGYGQIQDYVGDRYRPVLAHRVAWELVNGPIPDGLFACHKCDNPPCCNPGHLFLGTPLDNVQDMIAKQRQTRGRDRPHSKLTDDQIREIRATPRTPGSGQRLAERFGVHHVTISEIRLRKTWRWLP